MSFIERRVMIFGTFDRFHPGHRYFIEKAGAMGSEFFGPAQNFQLVVVVARDKTVRRLKGFLKNSEGVRVSVLQSEFPEVKVVLGHESDYMKVVRDYTPALICLGYDQEGFSSQLLDEFPEIEIRRLESFRPDEYKSSKMSSE